MEDEGLAPGTVLDGKFRIVRCLGSGGMGAVYEVRHEITRHRRALKLLHPGFATQREPVERFLREASVAGRIDNPHITETYDAGWLSSGAPYVVMEYLEGETVGQKLEREGVLPLEFVLTVMSQTCRGLESAHEAGIVHRDLKPDNLFVTDRDGAPFVKILDFGISKFEDLGPSRPTQDGAFMGTPWYMSPEQFLDGKTVDARADIYSLGVIFFECATGRHPYPADTLAKLATKIMVDETPPASTLRAAVPAAIDQVIARAMRKDPAERFPSAMAMARAIEAIQRDGVQTLPQGSFWTDALPPRGEAVLEGDKDVSPLSSAPTTLASGHLAFERSPARSAPGRGRWGRRFWLPMLGVGLATAAIIAFLALHEPEPPSATTSAPEATAPEVSAADTSAPEAPSPTPSASQSAASAATAPEATPTAAPGKTPRPAPPAAPKPDYATMEEFPE